MSLTDEVFGKPACWDVVFGKPARQRYFRVFYNLQQQQELGRAIQNKNPVVVFFWEGRNEPCKAMFRPFRNIALHNKQKAAFCLVNVDKFKNFVAEYKVEALPTFVLIKDGVECHRIVGNKTQELNKAIIKMVTDEGTATEDGAGASASQRSPNQG